MCLYAFGKCCGRTQCPAKYGAYFEAGIVKGCAQLCGYAARTYQIDGGKRVVCVHDLPREEAVRTFEEERKSVI